MLREQGYKNLILVTHRELDLANQAATRDFFYSTRPDYTIVCSGKVGGIHANNSYPASFIYENLMIECNIINSAFLSNCTNLIFLGSSCIYPRLASQPICEENLLQGYLEPTNEPYAIAKIAGIKLCESYNRQYGVDYRSLMPTNLYGPGDNFHVENAHVLPALLYKFHNAKLSNSKSVTIWGSGNPRREFLYIKDLAQAVIHSILIPKKIWNSVGDPMCSHINVGTGKEISIGELAEKIAAIVGFNGQIQFDLSRPDGMPRKLLDVSRIHSFGWQASTPLEAGITETYKWFVENQKTIRK